MFFGRGERGGVLRGHRLRLFSLLFILSSSLPPSTILLDPLLERLRAEKDGHRVTARRPRGVIINDATNQLPTKSFSNKKPSSGLSSSPPASAFQPAGARRRLARRSRRLERRLGELGELDGGRQKNSLPRRGE